MNNLSFVYLAAIIFAVLLSRTSAVVDNDIKLRMEKEREVASRHRENFDKNIQELRRVNEERMRQVQEHAQKTRDEINQYREGVDIVPGKKDKLDNSRSEDDTNRILETKLRLEKLREESRSHRSDNGNLNSILARHSVNPELIEEISRMSSASIPHESMIKHVKQHFPEKRPDEWNDIVLAALGARKKPFYGMDNERAREIDIENKHRRFDRMKAAFEARTSRDL